jgi:hypothetical protein
VFRPSLRSPSSLTLPDHLRCPIISREGEMYWNKGEKKDLANFIKSLGLGTRVAIKQARGEELSPEDEHKLWQQIKKNQEK